MFTSILKNFTYFAENTLARLNELSINVDDLELDHFAYQTSSTEEYEAMKKSATQVGRLESESNVDNRKVGIFKLNVPVKYKQYETGVFELVEPIPGKQSESRIYHIEFVLKESFDEFLLRYPAVSWDLRAKDREIFPKITLNFEDGTSVKFHTKNILGEI